MRNPRSHSAIVLDGKHIIISLYMENTFMSSEGHLRGKALQIQEIHCDECHLASKLRPPSRFKGPMKSVFVHCIYNNVCLLEHIFVISIFFPSRLYHNNFKF